jgi:serine/alanine adding enzyme
MMSIEVAELTTQELDQWDAYVRNAPHSHPFQLSAWRQIMYKCYGHRSWYLFAHEQGRIVGVLPLFEVRSRLLGASITSLPGGFTADSADSAAALLDRATEAARSARARCLSIRDSVADWGNGRDWQQHSSVAVVELPGDYQTLCKQLKRQMWQHVKKAQASGVETHTFACERLDQLDDFYFSLCQLFHEKGAPVFGRGFFDAILQALPGQAMVTTARIEGEVTGAVLYLAMGDKLFALWGGAPSRYLEQRVSHALWWEAMRYGVEHGYRWLDMGRSPQGSGLEEFKKRWGATAHPVYRLQRPVCGKVTYDPMQDTDCNRRYQIFTQVWRNLPFPVTCFLGPKLRRHMPFA